MPNPKRKHSKQRSRKKRTGDTLKVRSVSTCSNCGVSKLPHRVCTACGYYRGRPVLEDKKQKEEKNKKEK